jgi:hypothetical protein
MMMMMTGSAEGNLHLLYMSRSLYLLYSLRQMCDMHQAHRPTVSVPHVVAWALINLSAHVLAPVVSNSDQAVTVLAALTASLYCWSVVWRMGPAMWQLSCIRLYAVALSF